MNARDKILRDNGLLMLATAIAMGTAGGALAAKQPDPHNFAKPDPHNFVHRSSLEGHVKMAHTSLEGH